MVAVAATGGLVVVVAPGVVGDGGATGGFVEVVGAAARVSASPALGGGEGLASASRPVCPVARPAKDANSGGGASVSDDGATTGTRSGLFASASAATVVFGGRRASGSSVICLRTLPTAADATNTATTVVRIQASTIPTEGFMCP